MKNKIHGVRSRVLIGQSASAAVLSGFSAGRKTVITNLHEAFLLMRRLAIRYRRDDGVRTRRVVEPHYLMLNYPVWYVLAWDELRQDVRTFRCDRLLSAAILEEGFKLRPLSQFRQALEGVEAVLP